MASPCAPPMNAASAALYMSMVFSRCALPSTSCIILLQQLQICFLLGDVRGPRAGSGRGAKATSPPVSLFTAAGCGRGRPDVCEECPRLLRDVRFSFHFRPSLFGGAAAWQQVVEPPHPPTLQEGRRGGKQPQVRGEDATASTRTSGEQKTSLTPVQ